MATLSFSSFLSTLFQPHLVWQFIGLLLILIIVQECLPREIFQKYASKQQIFKTSLRDDQFPERFSQAAKRSCFRFTFVSCPSSHGCFQACFLILELALLWGLPSLGRRHCIESDP